ncbi:MauE/DoxX family redox-associated membrane protein [Sphingobacterium gobiense]|uniref:DoxX family protein n=1 Tax=Sphingobacterium gobiense TaxID=1382456 RepID=A0A2S9JW48_9SPHI|nr:DoxX family membrane protein [Sphingobacterium gobiense]PRD57470.1 DoxX family protein [Sphingobacterium gobiense]
MKIIKFILCLLFGILFVNAGLDKFLHYMPIPEMDAEIIKIGEAMMTIKWIIPLTGFIEIVGGILFIFPKTRALGAIVILPVMVGIVIHNIIFMPSGLIMAGILFLINLWAIYDNREKYRLLIS